MNGKPFRPKTQGERIAHLRRILSVYEGRAIEMSEIAARCGTTRLTVHRWENDSATPRADASAQLARVLHTTEAYIRFGVSAPNGQEGALVVFPSEARARVLQFFGEDATVFAQREQKVARQRAAAHAAETERLAGRRARDTAKKKPKAVAKR